MNHFILGDPGRKIGPGAGRCIAAGRFVDEEIEVKK